ncbi:MAG: DUF3881 family protein [Lachnospiraceae bacterium]
MHQYLRAVGFSNIRTKKDLRELLNDIIINPNEKDFLETDRSSVLVEYSKEYSESAGMTLRGEYDAEDNLTLDFYYPFCKGMHVSTDEDITVERHAEKESFAGVCDDLRVGVSLIFYLQNGIAFMKENIRENLPRENTSVNLAGLSIQGKIMLPIKKNEKEKERIQKAANDRNQLIVAARQGDEEALENLTLDDIDTYTMISRKILKEDVFSLVDTYFMPYGVECDQYSILGEIEDFTLETNSLTNEEIYSISINCNGLLFDICINKTDLLGEPQVGRRFKGTVWLQGKINFPD